VPEVEIPRRYRGPTRGRACIRVEAHTVRECIEAVEAEYPGFLELVLDAQGDLRRFVRLFVNGDAIAAGALDAPVGEGDRIGVLAAAAGG
jgi:molybdopterin converting factor small subunit